MSARHKSKLKNIIHYIKNLKDNLIKRENKERNPRYLYRENIKDIRYTNNTPNLR